MGLQVIKQPNGKLALFSSNNDQFVGIDLDEEAVIKYFVDSAKEDAEYNARRVLSKVLSNDDPYPFEETVVLHRRHEINSSPQWREKVEEMIKSQYQEDSNVKS
jgi:hypothetical protein